MVAHEMAISDRLPLSDVSVLDLSDEALAFGGRLLAALGARVIRVEPLAGDSLRRRPPFLDGLPGPERSLAHLLYNAGKQSVALDLARPAGWEIASRLADFTDVTIAPIEPGALLRSFLDPVRMASAHPEAAVVEAVLRRDRPEAAVSDLIGTAAGGLLYLNGFPDDPPNVPAGRLAYKQVSLAAALAALSLVVERRRNGTGGRIVVSMQEAVTWTTIQTANENYWHWHEQKPHRQGIHNLGGRTVYPARDGRWVSFYLHPPYWDHYVRWAIEVTGSNELAAPCWQDRLYRYQHGGTLIPATTAAICQTLDRDELVAEAQLRSLLVVPVQTPSDIASDHHLRDRGFFQSVSHPALDRDLQVMRPPFLSSLYRSHGERAPLLGEHTAPVLRELDYSESDISRLVADEAVLVSAPASMEVTA